jgi:hypothetical protein
MMSPNPQWSFLFLWLYCHPDYDEDVAGDPEEMFRERETALGIHQAHWLPFLDMLVLFRPEMIELSQFINSINNTHYE